VLAVVQKKRKEDQAEKSSCFLGGDVVEYAGKLIAIICHDTIKAKSILQVKLGFY